MFQTLTSETLMQRPIIRASMLQDRARQFVSRHQWRLHVDAEGFELDEYDCSQTTYCIVEKDRRHVASLRLRPAKNGSMVEDHFAELWEAGGTDLRRLVEVTRFCAATDLSASSREIAISDLLLGLCQHCMDSGIPKFFGVVFPSVARVLTQAGWAPEVIATSRQNGQALLLATWDANVFTQFDLKAARTRRREARKSVNCMVEAA